VNLPSALALTVEQVDQVVAALGDILQAGSAS
jgi:hypothetical protein